MVLNTQIIEKIKSKSGLSFEKVKDFDILCSKIFDETQRTIGVTTLKRLLGYISDPHNANEYTLNTIAIYLGYSSWRDLCKISRIDSLWNFDDKSIYIEKLPLNTEIEIKYLNRVVRFKVVNHNNCKAIQVMSVLNSSLKPGDILYVHKIVEGSSMWAEKVYRGDLIGNYKTNGEIKSVKLE